MALCCSRKVISSLFFQMIDFRFVTVFQVFIDILEDCFDIFRSRISFKVYRVQPVLFTPLNITPLSFLPQLSSQFSFFENQYQFSRSLTSKMLPPVSVTQKTERIMTYLLSCQSQGIIIWDSFQSLREKVMLRSG